MEMYITECQTENTITYSVQCECLCAHAQLQLSPEFSVRMMLEGNDKLTRYYTGLPTYNSFVAFVEYLTPKAVALTPWNCSNTRDVVPQSSVPISQPFAGLTIADQLFSILILLRRGLEAFDVSIRFQISEATYSRLFATWILFLSKELKLLFPFPTRDQVLQ